MIRIFITFECNLLQGDRHEAIKVTANAANGSSTNISIARLDDLFAGMHIHLLKMDCQGCELKTIKGARQLLESKLIHAVAFEFAPHWLRTVGDNPVELLLFFRQHGFDLWSNAGPGSPGWAPGGARPLYASEGDMRSLAAKYATNEDFEDLVALPTGVPFPTLHAHQ